MPDSHAKVLRPSSSERFLNCTPSARLEADIPDVTTPYAEEGTEAHSLCEYKLRKYVLGEKKLSRPKARDEEMERCTDDYKDFVEEEFAAAKAKTPDSQLFVEQQLDLKDYVPESFGTSDAVIVSDELLEVIDFKYGKGVPVDAEGNTQLRLYALGTYTALSTLFDFTTIKTVIFQPRLNSITSETISVDELLDWAENYVKPRAKMAYEGEGEFVVGDWCRFCKAGSKCRARAEAAFKVIDMTETNPDLLDDSEIPPILDKLDETEKWIAAVRKYAQDMAISGKVKWPGYKLVEGRTMRKVDDQLGAMNALISEGYSKEEVTNTKLKGITDLEKLLGKTEFARVLGGYVIKPKGEPTLVKETDKRPEINPVNEMFKEE